MSAEEIYRLLPPDSEHATLDRHIADAPGAGGVAAPRPRAVEAPDAAGDRVRTPAVHADAWDDAGNEGRTRSGSETPPPLLLPDELERLGRQWQSRVVIAEQHARQAGRLSSSCSRLVREAVRPRLPWRVLLSRYMAALGRNDFSFRRPSRREGAALLPSLATEDIDIVVAIDTSGSLTDADLAEFAAEMNAMKGELHGRVTLLACDEALDERGPWRFEPWEPISMPPDLRGGGGTCFVPVFDWIERTQPHTDVLVYFTDAEGEFPAWPPRYPVLWLVKGGGTVPWGDRIQLD
jgi:hypothetical protein